MIVLFQRHGSGQRSVSGIIAALIILLMFVGIVFVYYAFINAQQRIFSVQSEAARLYEKLAAVSRAVLLYYTIVNQSTSYIAEIVIENKASSPITINDLLMAYSYAGKPYAIVVIGNKTDSDAPTFTQLAQLIQQLAGITPGINITLVFINGTNETLEGLPATLEPGEKLIIDIGPLPLDFRIISLEAEAIAALPGGAIAATIITPKYAQPVATAATTVVPPVGAGTGTSQQVLFDVVTWVYGVPLKIKCLYDRYNWPVVVAVNFTALGVDYNVDPLGIRVLDLDNNVYVPVNATKVGNNYFIIVFPLTCKAGETRNFTIYAAGGPLSHPEGFYPVGLARLWNNTITLEQGVNIYSASGLTYYYLLEAPAGYLDPLSEATLETYEQLSPEDTNVTLTQPIPYYDVNLTSVYVWSDARINETQPVDTAPSVVGLESSYHSAAVAWISGWKYYITINFTNEALPGFTAQALSNILVNISTKYLPSSVVSHLFAHARSDGGDIIFVDLDTGQLLPFLTVEWNPAAQEAEWLVKIPGPIAPGQSVHIALYYGNPGYDGSVKTRVDLPGNLEYVYSFLSDIQPPSIHGYAYNYTFATLPVNTWRAMLEATNYSAPNATASTWATASTPLPAGIIFPFFGVAYDTGDWQAVAAGYLNYDNELWTSIDFAYPVYLGSATAASIELYYNTSYSDEIGSGLLVRYNLTFLYVTGFPIWNPIWKRIYIVAELNGSVVMYTNGVVRLVYGGVYVNPSYTPPTVQIDVSNSTYAGTAARNTVVYDVVEVDQLAYHPDVLAIPYFALPAQLPTQYNFAIPVYNASLNASLVALKGYSGGGFTVYHWRSSIGVYSAGFDVAMWASWAGDILLTIYRVPLEAGGAQLNYTIGFAPGIAGDPGIIVESDADGIAATLNLTAFAVGSVSTPPKELLLLRYNGSYVVYLSRAQPEYPWVVGWLHGLRVVIENPNNFDIQNYVVKVVLGAGNLTSDYLSSPYFGRDIRVLDSSGNRLPFYVSYYNVSEPLIVLWVKVPYLPADSNTTIYIYYYAVPPTGVNVVDDSNPYATFIAYLGVVPGECPEWDVVNISATYQCSSVTLGGYPQIDEVNASLGVGGLVRFYNTSSFIPSGVYGYEYRAVVIPMSSNVEIDVGVELVPAGSETGSPYTAGSYAVIFGTAGLARLVQGSVQTIWDQGTVGYSVNTPYLVVIRVNQTTMQTLVYNLTTGQLVASATDTGLDIASALEAAIVSYSSAGANAVYGLLPDLQQPGVYVSRGWWVRPWVYNEPHPVSAVLLS